MDNLENASKQNEGKEDACRFAVEVSGRRELRPSGQSQPLKRQRSVLLFR